MHNKDKYPEIWAAKQAAEDELAPLMLERQKHTDKIAELQIEIDALESQKASLNDEAMKDASRILELRNKIARMAQAMGATMASKSV